jgi:hypothetical protein
MDILLVELDPNDISVDEILFPNKQTDEFIYEHLLHYYSRLDQLPTIEVIVCANSIVGTSGHIYLIIAKKLQYQRIRAFINPSSPAFLVSNLLQRASVSRLDWNMLMENKNKVLVGFFWYIFFFEKSLGYKNRVAFEEEIVEFFRKIMLPTWAEVPNNRIKNLNYPYSGQCAEFQAYVPIADERWYAASRAIIVNFHHKHIPIVSFQGRKFLE